MNAIRLLVMLCILHSNQSHLVQRKSEINKKSGAKSREVEAFTTILLDDEAYSIQPAEKKLKKPPSGTLASENDKILKSKVLKNGLHSSKGNRGRKPYKTHGAKTKPGLPVSKNISHSKDGIHPHKNNELKNKKKISVRKSISNSSKKLQKRYFDSQSANFWNRGEGSPGYYYNQNYRSVSNSLNLSSTPGNPYSKQIENSPTTSTRFYVLQVNNSNFGYDSYSPSGPLWEHNQDFNLNRPFREPETNPAKSSKPVVGFHPRMAPQNNQTDSGRSGLYGDNLHKKKIRITNVHPLYVTTSEKSPETTPRFFEVTFVQGNAVERSPHAARPHQQKSEKERLEEQLQSDESDNDGTEINFGENCEQVMNETCWITREVGDVLTLAVDIQSSKDLSSFQVRWLKVYHMYGSKKGKPLEVKPDKLPWNMVSGSEGRELRLNPVTNTDIDPNCIVAKVFLLSKKGGKVLYTFIKRLIYRIEIPVIDMGEIYSGEELSINLENFISLPERGDLRFDWTLETAPHQLQSLPSNIKVSHTGRSVVLKELKKGRLGILNCVVYSISRFAVAKRRFNILKIGESVKRRSTIQHRSGVDKLSPSGRNLRCRRVIRRSQEEAMQRLRELTIPKSRKKRFKRSETVTKILECEPLRKKMYSRWIRSLFGGSMTTEDPRLMPVLKLLELSEQGDGTLDDIMPHEVHYVHPDARVVTGTYGERSVERQPFNNCTSDTDCSNNSICAEPYRHPKDSDSVRYCYCRPNYYEDGYTCRKIPLSIHREKRLKRGAQKDMAIPQHLFYEGSVQRSASIAEEQVEKVSMSPPKVLAFEEEESFLLSDCLDDKDCSSHASCVQPANGHPYCKCRPGFRGNGIFCWEIIDYVPPEEENLSSDEQVYPGDANYPNQNIDHLSSVTPMSSELEEE